MNGWTNEETANFMLWHADDIEAYVSKWYEYFATLDEDELADDIESFAYGLVGLNSLPIGFARDAAATNFLNINWREIARANQSIIDAATTNDDEE